MQITRKILTALLLLSIVVLSAQDMDTLTDGMGRILTDGMGRILVSSGPVNYPNDVAPSFNILEEWDWDGETLGDWTDAEMTTWGASATGFWTHNEPPDYMWSIVTDTINGTISNAMRTKHVADDINRLAEMRRSLPSSYDTIFSSVNIKFGKNWTSSTGKSHGLRTILGANCFDDSDGTLVASNFKEGGSFYPYNYEHTLAQPSCPTHQASRT